jgi:undecaprenyl-diphosphatase
METIKILILAVVQGITELLPVSSTGHLIIVGRLIDLPISDESVFLSVLHIGTTLAIILFFRKELFEKFFTKKKLTFYLKLAIASIPAALVGFLFEEQINNILRGNTVIAISLIVVGILFIIFENVKSKKNTKTEKDTDIENIPLWKMFIIGIGQSLALIPGTSRSGTTTLTGMLLGLDKYTAFNFSFILGIPVILGGSLYEVGKSYLSTTDPSMLTASLTIVKILPAIILTFIIGYIALLVIKRFKKSKWLTVFGIYRIVIGILILIFAI